MEIWDGSRGRGATATVIPLKVLGLTLVELSTLPGYLAGTQPHKLSVSPSIQLPVGFQAPRETWAARAQGAMSQVTFPLQQCPGPQSTPELLLCGTATDFQASSEVSPQSLNFPVSREKWRGPSSSCYSCTDCHCLEGLWQEPQPLASPSQVLKEARAVKDSQPASNILPSP